MSSTYFKITAIRQVISNKLIYEKLDVTLASMIKLQGNVKKFTFHDAICLFRMQKANYMIRDAYHQTKNVCILERRNEEISTLYFKLELRKFFFTQS